MPQFFHGWRRKAGCVTLVMALVFMAEWAISLIWHHRTLDSRDFVQTPYGLAVFSEQQSVGLAISSEMILPKEKRPEPHDPIVVKNADGSVSTQFEISEVATVHEILVELPYWSIVFPLILLSAWLLWPRNNPKTVAETPPVTA